MFSFLKKPYVFTTIISVLLTGFLAWSLLEVFVIPRAADPEAEYETLDLSKFPPATSPDVPGQSGGNTITLPPSFLPQDPSTGDPSGPTEDMGGDKVEYPIITDTSYKDEHISITLSTIRRYDSNIHVAEVILDSPTYLKTALAKDEFGQNIKEKTSEQAKRVGAILAINGDFYGANKEGYVIRNGTLYRDSIRSSRFEDLAILYDGSLFPFYEKDYTPRDLLHKYGAMQVLGFGPTLLKDGQLVVDTDTEVNIYHDKLGNPRTIIGIVEPGHYFFVVADGRTKESFGPTLYHMALVMQELGCDIAYNLDGGGSATLYFNGRVVNYPSTDGTYKERSVSDIVYIGY